LNIKPILVTKDFTIRQTMKVIDEAPHKDAPAGIALVVDETNKLLGIVTDGDIRRATLKNINLDSPIETIMTTNPVVVDKKLSSSEMLDIVLKRTRERRGLKIDKIIVTDEEGRVDDIISFFDVWRKSEIKTREVCIVGLGYVGLTLAASLSNVGFRIIGVDHNEKIVEMLRQGKSHIHEVGLESLLEYHLNKTFFIKPDLERSESDVYIICVETPIDENNVPIMKPLEKATTSIGKVLKKDDLVIVRSTIPIGICRHTVLPILEKESGLTRGRDFFLAFAPERTIEGKALEELKTLPQIVGGLDKISVELASKLFRELAPLIISVDSLESAELVKLVNNTYRDLKFAYANELALICDKLGLDTVKLIRAANEGYLRGGISVPSPGVGGICLKKDSYIFMNSVKEIYSPLLVRDARKINELMPLHIAQKIYNFVSKEPSKTKIFIIGFAFKGQPETADMRESSTLDLLKHLRIFKFTIHGYDPVVPREEIEKLELIVCDLEQGFDKADCVLIMNNHESYSKIDIYSLLNRMNRPGLFFDGWHIFSKEIIERVDGITYEGLGV